MVELKVDGPDGRFGMTLDGGVPVFHPSYKEFCNFQQFVEQIEPIGMQTGIVKIVPPQEWLHKLPPYKADFVDTIKLRKPIVQTSSGNHGIHEFKNLEKARTYTISAWNKLCAEPQNSPPAPRGEERGNTSMISDGQFLFDDSKFTTEHCRWLERNYWRMLGFSPPMYGADMPGSLFPKDLKEWNVAQLESILNLVKEKVSGVNTPYLYCGMWRASFPWHLEDMDLPSINYIHFGAPKQWYAIPQKDKDKFEKLMKLFWPQEVRKCPEFLRHKTFMVSPSVLEQHGITVNRCVHRQREFVITFPYGYHAGFNFDCNVAESVNFATERWLEIGLRSRKCECIVDSVGLDVQQLVRLVRGPQESELISETAETIRDLADFEEPTAPLDSTNGLEPERKRRRRSIPKTKYSCWLCPNKWDSLLLPCAGGRRVHKFCAIVVPEFHIDFDEQVSIDGDMRERKKLVCDYCHIRTGACIQCADPLCFNAYHPTCAPCAGMFTVNLCHFCSAHRSDHGGPEATADIFNAVTKGPGDIVEAHIADRTCAGMVTENNLAEQQLTVKVLPNMDTSEKIRYDQLDVCTFCPVPSDVAVKLRTAPKKEPKKSLTHITNISVRPKKQPPVINVDVPKTEVRSELYMTYDEQGHPVTPFVFMGVPLPPSLLRPVPL